MLILLALILALTPAAGLSQTHPVSPVPDIALGFGPFSMVPVSMGTPVFAMGDSLWAQSYYNSSAYSISVNSPNGTVVISTLGPGNLINLHTFSTGDRAGTWTLGIYDYETSTTSQLSFLYVNASEVLTPGYVGANVTRNSLYLEYMLPSTAAYDIQACTMGASAGPTTDLLVPGSAGGLVELSLNGSTAVVAAPTVRAPLPAWFELYTPRYYMNGTVVLSDEALAAQSGVLSIGGQLGSVPIRLSNDLNLRVGRYDLRSYVRGPSGLVSFDTPYLKVNDTRWLSLAGCTQLSDVTSSTFVMTTNLDDSNSTWPREVYTMYAANGLDSFSVSKVQAGPARIDILGPGPSQKVSRVNATLTGAGVQGWASYNSSVYILGDSFPLVVSLQVSFAGVTSRTFNITIDEPYSHIPLRTSVGQLLVQTTVNGTPLANDTIYVSTPGSRPTAFKTGGTGNFALTLPPGQYNVTSTYGGSTVTDILSVQAGSKTNSTLELGSQDLLPILLVFGAILIAAAGLNLLVWQGYRKRKATFR